MASARSRRRAPCALLTVQEGCDKFCTFCVVPYTRGAEISRSMEQILEEARRLADQGVREITLLGQNVNAWHGRGAGGATLRLGDLLHQLGEINGLDRLRYTTSHPIDMDESLIAAHRDLPKLMPYLHLPVQAGSDRILKAMNRRHDSAWYLEIIARIRRSRPDIAISGDFIVGFPGENDADFAATLALVEQVGYASAYSFKYSPRPGTPGADFSGQVDDAAKAARLARLQNLLRTQQLSFNRACVGRVLDVLVDKPGPVGGGMGGRSPYLQTVTIGAGNLDAPTCQIGDIVHVRVTDAGPYSLTGEIA